MIDWETLLNNPQQRYGVNPNPGEGERFMTNPFGYGAVKAALMRTPEQQAQFDQAEQHARTYPGNRYDSQQLLRNMQGWGADWMDPRQQPNDPGFVPREPQPAPPVETAPPAGVAPMEPANPNLPVYDPGTDGAAPGLLPPGGGGTLPPGGDMSPPTDGGGDPFVPSTGVVKQWFSPGQNPTNEAFYTQQFNRMLGARDQQRQRENQARGQWNQWQAEQNRKQAQQPPMQVNWEAWDALAGREPTVGMAPSDAGYNAYTFNPLLERGMTNSQVFNALRGSLSDADQHTIQNLVVPEYNGQPNPFHSGKEWSTFSSPQNLNTWLGKQGFEQNRSDALNNLFGNIYTQSQYTTPEGGGPTAAPGYALPI